MAKKYLTRKEIGAVLENLEAPYDMIMEIMAWTGRRPTEVLMMQRGDIDHENKIIEFNQLKKRGKKIDDPYSKRVYERKKATKPLDCSAFYEHLLRHLETIPYENYIFPSPRKDNAHLTIRMLQIKVKKAAEEAGIEAHPHIFRHSFSVQYLEKRINQDKIDPIQALYELKNLLGHASLDTTMGYLAYVTGKESLKDLWGDKEVIRISQPGKQ